MGRKSEYKITHHTKAPDELKNFGTERPPYLFLEDDAILHDPSKDGWRNRLIKTMINWATKQSSLDIMQFCVEYHMRRTTLYRWASEYPDIKDALDEMRLRLAGNRRVGSMTRKLDGHYAYKDMHELDPLWDKVNKYHADLKTETEKQAHTFIIDNRKPNVEPKQSE